MFYSMVNLGADNSHMILVMCAVPATSQLVAKPLPLLRLELRGNIRAVCTTNSATVYNLVTIFSGD
jgi:hypothetical protein